MIRSLAAAAQMLNRRQLAIQVAACPICGPTVLVKLCDGPVGVRCIRCGGSAIHMSMVSVLQEIVPDIGRMKIYELSSRGVLFDYLKKRCSNLTCSEFYDDVPPGDARNGIQCQDVEHLTYGDGVFDLCTSTEVFEHVPDDLQGFREICRVLVPGGKMLFTVPLSDAVATVERARIVDGRVEYLQSPVYHGDRIRGRNAVLCFRDYGADIVDRVRAGGFSGASIIKPVNAGWWGQERQVIVAKK